MQIYVDGSPAALKSGSAFDIVSENRLFTGADAFSMAITFPLRGCAQNLAIFGHVCRTDIDRGKAVYECEIRDGDTSRYGSLAITQVTQAEITGQFLEGRCAQNFDKTFDKIYINELDLGGDEAWDPKQVVPSIAWRVLPAYTGSLPESVALPWVCDGSGNLQNDARKVGNIWGWTGAVSGLSRQPFLYHLVRRILAAVGYTANLDAWWAREDLRYMLVCNALPYAWNVPGYARALPHWSVKEFFEKLEMFLGAEFDFDHRAKRVTFSVTADTVAARQTVHIEKVIDEFEEGIDYERQDSQYMPARNRRYKDCSHRMWKFYSCRWFVEMKKQSAVKYATLQALVNDLKQYLPSQYKYDHRGGPAQKIYYAADVDMFFLLDPVWRDWQSLNIDYNNGGRWLYTSRLQPLNNFGELVMDDDDEAQTDELEFVPVRLDDTDKERGRVMFLDCGQWNEAEVDTETEEDPFWVPSQICALEKGEEQKKQEYYDRIFIGWWDGTALEDDKLPFPSVYDVDIADDGSKFRSNPFSLRLRASASSAMPMIDVQRSVKFSFLSDSVPDPRALFIIRGKRYVCEKITATYTEHGRSRMMKGVFWPVKES